MLGNAAPTPFDLRFSLFGIPVRVHPLFWVFSAVMGWDPDDPNVMFLWIGCVFVSVLVHELGHAIAARLYGWNPQIVLYAFGGYAAFVPTWGYTTWRAVIVLLAGPGAGFLLLGLLWAVATPLVILRVLPVDLLQNEYLTTAFAFLTFINLAWGLVNLLPVYPLDGGQITRALLTRFRPRDGLDISLKLSLLVSAGAAVLFLVGGQMYAGILFGSLAFESLQYLQGARYR
ncbi:MAG: site-2 protease family protein [Planctomycetaceae bacterium]